MPGHGVNDPVGAWELVAHRIIDLATSKSIDFPLSEHVRGLITYTRDGHMSVQITAPASPPYADVVLPGGTIEERAAAAHGYLAYVGTYTITEDTVVQHHVDCSLFPNWENTPVPRRATIDNHQQLRLELVQPLIVDGKERGGVPVWKRLGAQVDQDP
ncbi:MAG: lipocalin-like domain-containing protein [Nocardioidaceae bacterium]